MKTLRLTLLVIILMGIFAFSGCTRPTKIPIVGGANYSECKFQQCKLDMSFAPDSILTVEQAPSCKAIFYAGEIFVLGDGFSSLWIGEIEDQNIEFSRKPIPDSPVKNVKFDWENGHLVITWTGASGMPGKISLNSEGKIKWQK